MNSIASPITKTAAVALCLAAALSTGPASAGDDKKINLQKRAGPQRSSAFQHTHVGPAVGRNAHRSDGFTRERGLH